MKNKKYHIIGTVPLYNRKLVETEAKSISLTNKYMTAHFIGVVLVELN